MKEFIAIISLTILLAFGATVLVPVIIYPLNYVSCKINADARDIKNWSTSLDKCYFEIDGKMINSVNYDKVVFGNTLNIREGE